MQFKLGPLLICLLYTKNNQIYVGSMKHEGNISR